MPCSSTDLSINISPNSASVLIAGLGNQFAPKLPNFTNPFVGLPEDLLDVVDLLQFILPSGTLKPSLSINFGKDIFDGIMSLLDKFLPFLMLYKFFLPILELVICIIEVLCAIPNPFKLSRALRRLFRVCLPNFLALFPIFALILMIMSLMILILNLIEYITAQVLKVINILLKNIRTIGRALTKADDVSILAAIRKIGTLLCGFQNLFAILTIFKVIIDTINDMIKMAFPIPPCDDGDNGNEEKCCSPEVCPSFIKNNDEMSRTTGTFQYYNKVGQDANLASVISGLPAGFFTNTVRNESWQFYDARASIPEAFWNITSAYDLPPGISQVFFPTDANYQASTPSNQAPYLVDLRLFYNPSSWGRSDLIGSRFVRIKNCIVLRAPSQGLLNYDNSSTTITNGVLEITGGSVFEDDGSTQVFINGNKATLNNLIHKEDEIFIGNPITSPSDGYNFTNVDYTFHINHEVLLQKALITLGCMPEIALDRSFINSVFGGNAGANFSLLNEISLGFPDIGATQECLSTALAVLRSNISEQGVAIFQATTTICLNKLNEDTTGTINSLIEIGFDQYKSTFTINPSTQFTTSSILVQLTLNETNGQNIAANLPAIMSGDIVKRIEGKATFGSLSDFTYDGYGKFNAQITSLNAGSGTIQISFDNKIISIATVPADLSKSPIITPIVLPYTFIYSPAAFGTDIPRRDETDVANNSNLSE